MNAINQLKDLDSLRKEGDILVSEISGIVRSYNPLELLRHGRNVMKRFSVKAEKENMSYMYAGMKMKNQSIRLIDYVQSLIVSVEPGQSQKDFMTDAEWYDLEKKINNLFDICLLLLVSDDKSIEGFDKLLPRSIILSKWFEEKGNRYDVHLIPYLKEIFVPHSEILHKLFGVSAEEFVKGFWDIWMLKFLYDLCSDEAFELSDMKTIFNLQSMTRLPSTFLDRLSLSPGEDVDFFSAGEYRGWPCRVLPVASKPFLKIGKNFYCFESDRLFDNLYRNLQRVLFESCPYYKNDWNRTQAESAEKSSLELFKRIVPEAKILRNVFYGPKSNRCEVDAILIYDEYLFVIEVKAGAFTYTSPVTDYKSHLDSVRNLISKASQQGQRFLDYYDNEGNISLFDKDGKVVCEFSKDQFKYKVVFAIMLEQFTEVFSQIHLLKKAGLDIAGSDNVWALGIEDLYGYADMFENHCPLYFFHFLEQRVKATKWLGHLCQDEHDYLGIYLKDHSFFHNIDVKRTDNNTGSDADLVWFDDESLRAEISEFFSERFFDKPSSAFSVDKDVPVYMRNIIEMLYSQHKAGHSTVSSYILNMRQPDFSELLERFTKIPDKISTDISTGFSQNFEISNNVNITAFCSTNGKMNGRFGEGGISTRDWVQMIALMNEEERRLLLKLDYSETKELQDVSWEWIKLEEIPDWKLEDLKKVADEVRKNRFNKIMDKRDGNKIGRNELCPCSSGKKYKKCCGSIDRIS